MNTARQALGAQQEQRRRRLVTGSILAKPSIFREFTRQGLPDHESIVTESGDWSTPRDTSASRHRAQVCNAERKALAALQRRFPTARFLDSRTCGKGRMHVVGVTPSLRTDPARRWHQPLPWACTTAVPRTKSDRNPEREQADANGHQEGPHHAKGVIPHDAKPFSPSPPPLALLANPHVDWGHPAHQRLQRMADALQGLEEEMTRGCTGANKEPADDDSAWPQVWGGLICEIEVDLRIYLNMILQRHQGNPRDEEVIQTMLLRGNALERRAQQDALLLDDKLHRARRNGAPLMRVWMDAQAGKATASDLLRALAIDTRRAEKARSKGIGACNSGRELAAERDSDAKILLSRVDQRHRPKWAWMLRAYEEGRPEMNMVLTQALCALIAYQLRHRDTDQDPLILAAVNACYVLGQECANAPLSPRHLYRVLDSWPLPFERLYKTHVDPRTHPKPPKRFSKSYLLQLTMDMVRQPAAALAWARLFNRCIELGVTAGNVRKVLYQAQDLMTDLIAAEVLELIQPPYEDWAPQPPLGVEEPHEGNERVAYASAGQAVAQVTLVGGGGGEGGGEGVIQRKQDHDDVHGTPASRSEDERTPVSYPVPNTPLGPLDSAAIKQGATTQQVQQRFLKKCVKGAQLLDVLCGMAGLPKAGNGKADAMTRSRGSSRTAPLGDQFPDGAMAAPSNQGEERQDSTDRWVQIDVTDVAGLALILMSMQLNTLCVNGHLVFQPGSMPQRARNTLEGGYAEEAPESETAPTTPAVTVEALAAAAVAAGDASQGLLMWCTDALPRSGTPGYDWARIKKVAHTVRSSGNVDAVGKALRDALVKKQLRFVWLQAQGMEGVMAAVQVLAKIRQEMLLAGRDLCATVSRILDIGDAVNADDLADNVDDNDNKNIDDTATSAAPNGDSGANNRRKYPHDKDNKGNKERLYSSFPEILSLDDQLTLLDYQLSQYLTEACGDDERQQHVVTVVCLERIMRMLEYQAQSDRRSFLLEFAVHECGVSAPWRLEQPQGAKALGAQQRQMAAKMRKMERLHRALYSK